MDGKRILIVDHDVEAREALAAFLRKQPVHVVEADDASAAMERLAEQRFSVLLLDVTTMDGEEATALLDHVAALPVPTAPVVLLLTGSEPRNVAHLDPQRVHGIIRKPFDPEELASLVRACAEIKSRNALGAMCMATMIAGGPILAWLSTSSKL